ncbi:MAG TPA: flagellar M-ring protein FliF, partial [Actinobacteria bacterium]|nr:flagellar M-ring protein FliF [Actinomycetota bacterium]
MAQRSFIDSVQVLPLAHKVVAGSALVVLALAGFLFFQWASTPTFAVLYNELDDRQLSEVIEGLDSQGVQYQVEAGGTRILVPRSQVATARARLASDGVSAGVSVEGYELLDQSGLSVSDFRQQIDYKRAIEGELSRTLVAMDAITSADILIVVPEEALFAQNQDPTTASVLIDSLRPLTVTEIETITFLVSSAVEGLEPDAVAVAHVDGQVLNAPGNAAGSSTVSNRNLRMVEDFESSLASDVQALLVTMLGPDRSSVIVRADLSFDEQSVETQTFEQDTATPLREQLLNEQLNGSGAPPVGTVGVNGEELPVDGDGAYTYLRDESTTEYGINNTTTLSVTAPGSVKSLSVAVAVDDGSGTGLPAPNPTQIEALVTAALGLNLERGDQIEVSAVAFALAEEPDAATAAAAEEATASPLDQLPSLLGAVAVVLIAAALLFMTRSGKGGKKSAGDAAAIPGGAAPALPPGAPQAAIGGGGQE